MNIRYSLVNHNEDIFSFCYIKISLKIFTGNTDRNSIVSQSLSPDNYTHYIRIHPLSWNESIAMRVEVYGCYEGMLVISCIELFLMYEITSGHQR